MATMLTATHLAALGSLGLTSICIALFIPMAARVSLLDYPDERKCHTAPTPTIGGVAMYVGVLASFVLTGLAEPSLGPLAAGSTLLVIVGFIDDFTPLGYRIRFVGQFIAAGLITIWGGLTVHHLGDVFGLGPIPLGVLATPLTMVAIVGVINGINMLDGLDGLAASVVICILSPVFAYASVLRHTSLAVACLLVIACVLGFLLFNFRFPWRDRAPVFMGNAGSNFLGFVVAWAVLSLAKHPQSHMPPIAVVWIVALPVIDTLVSMWRRHKKGRSMFSPDRDHVHHILQRAGFSVNATVLIIAGTTAILATTAIAASLYDIPHTWLFAGYILLIYLHNWFIASAWRFARTIRRLLERRDPAKWRRVANHLAKKR
jgi:UDP-GlcNAc:undecaprenyl-phosphate/decaprenyl-phosphate GlcNAc-1-phosphate transferase